jgi:hypothetical protein
MHTHMPSHTTTLSVTLSLVHPDIYLRTHTSSQCAPVFCTAKVVVQNPLTIGTCNAKAKPGQGETCNVQCPPCHTSTGMENPNHPINSNHPDIPRALNCQNHLKNLNHPHNPNILPGSTLVTCQADGQWSAVKLSCAKDACVPLGPVGCVWVFRAAQGVGMEAHSLSLPT